MGGRERTTVWLIEDDELTTMAIKNYLDETGDISCERYFCECDSALSALKSFHEDPPNVVLLDIGLPGMNGLDAIKRINQLSPATKIIMLTGSGENRDIQKAINEGADGYLLKGSSLSLEKVGHSIREIMKGGAVFDPEVSKKILDMFRSTNLPSANYGLTGREKQVVELIVDGLTMHEVASKLKITYNTITTHFKNIHQKMNVHHRSEVVAKAIKGHVV